MQRANKISVRTLTGLLVLGGFMAGCASDNSPPPFHTAITYDPSQSHTYVSAVPPTNAPSTRDWKTNQIVGLDYGTSGNATAPNAAPGAAGAGVGAASTPSGTSSGSAAGVTGGGAGVSTAPALAPAPASGAPGAIIGTPTSTVIGPAPSTITPGSTINTGTGQTAPSVGTGLNSTPFRASTLTPPGLSVTGYTNSGTGVTLTNTITGQTNLLPGSGLNRPSP
jgi:hypothetical protein